MEQPPRCYFSSKSFDKRLSSAKDGRVLSSSKRSNQESFVIHPQGNDLVMIQSFKHQGFLRCGMPKPQSHDDLILVGRDAAVVVHQTAMVFATKDKMDASLWCLEKVDGGFYITCMDENTYLACNENGDITLTKSKEQKWSIEFQMGELCFISSPALDRHLRCDLIGSLSLSEN
jgi:hypothetical protein